MTPITANAELQAFCARLKNEPFITVDTEFMRETTYWPKLCLIQVASATEDAVIDPLAEGLSLDPLLDLLRDERIIKVFHAARQDLEIFHNLGATTRPVFDSQVAAMAAQVAECAVGDRYFGVIDLIFANQQSWAAAKDPIAELAKPLRIAGLGENEIKACLADEAKANAVINDYRGGETLGVNSTPTLFINGEMYKGSRSVEDLDGVFSKLAK